MTYQVIVQNSKTGDIFDITTLGGSISHQTFISGQPGKLDVTLQQDPRNVLQLANGSMLKFTVDGVGIFLGYIFKMGTDATGVYKITAYDQLRYWSNTETYITGNATASDDFARICKDVYPALAVGSAKYKIVVPSKHIVPSYLHDVKKLFEVVQYGIDRSNVAETKLYFIKDKFGELQFTEIGNELTNLIIGERSLLTSYQYEISIDTDTFNTIKLYRDNESSGKRDVWQVFDSDTQNQWGKLQLSEKAPDEYNEAQISELAKNYLKLKNRETKTMKLTALGVVGLIAGSGFTFKLDKLNISEKMWITSATHNYQLDYHTMNLDVFSPIFEL